MDFLIAGFDSGNFTWNRDCRGRFQIKNAVKDADFMKTFFSFSGIGQRAIKIAFDINKYF